jgi:hypothetical protein
MEKMHERRARQLEGGELDIRIKEMHANIWGTELEQEEELREHEEALKKREEEVLAREQELEEWMKQCHNDY